MYRAYAAWSAARRSLCMRVESITSQACAWPRDSQPRSLSRRELELGGRHPGKRIAYSCPAQQLYNTYLYSGSLSRRSHASWCKFASLRRGTTSSLCTAAITHGRSLSARAWSTHAGAANAMQSMWSYGGGGGGGGGSDGSEAVARSPNLRIAVMSTATAAPSEWPTTVSEYLQSSSGASSS